MAIYDPQQLHSTPVLVDKNWSRPLHKVLLQDFFGSRHVQQRGEDAAELTEHLYFIDAEPVGSASHVAATCFEPSCDTCSEASVT